MCRVNQEFDPDKYKCSGYSIGFDSRSEFSFKYKRVGKNVSIFGVDMCLPVHISNKNKDILIIGQGTAQELGNTTLTAETKYFISFIQSGKRFLLSLHDNESNSFLFVNATQIY